MKEQFKKFKKVTMLGIALFSVVHLLGCSEPDYPEPGISETVVAEVEGKEQMIVATNIAYGWLNDLDRGDYELAAASFKVDGDIEKSTEELKSSRQGLNVLRERTYLGAYVTAISTDDVEYQIHVVYESVFGDETDEKVVAENVDVLIWHKEPVILHYMVMPYSGDPPKRMGEDGITFR